MRVLVAHNAYSSSMPSGENLVVEQEIDLLRQRGVEVETFIRSSDSLLDSSLAGNLSAGASMLTGRGFRSEFADSLKRFRPDVVHLHNPYPLLSPRLIDFALDAGVPSVATIHNYRVACMSGVMFRDGAGCTDCIDRNSSLPGVLHACYRSSRTQSAVMAAALSRNDGAYRRAKLLLPVSGFVASFLLRVGFDHSRVRVKYNSCPDPGAPTEPGSGFLYVGRLSEEKGVHLLLEAWERAGLGGRHSLTIVGSGPLRTTVEQAAERDSSLRFLGQQDATEVARLRRETGVAVVPSAWDEPYGITVVESLASARPVVGTRMGGIAELIDNEVGWLIEPKVDALTAAMHSAATTGDLSALGAAARSRYLRAHSQGAVTDILLEAYGEVIG